MPKMRTNRAAAKRFRRTGTGKIRCHKSCKSHMLTKKPRDRKRKLAKAGLISAPDFKRVSRLIGSSN
jgi:large subunit ribosomal protein L35